MKNTHEFEVTLSVRECAEHYGEFGAAYGAEALDMFAKALEAYGLEVTTTYTPSRKHATLTVRHPEAREAKRVRNRNPYGRPKRAKDYHGVTLEWLESHSVEDGMKALGVSRRTYYRRLEELRGEDGKTA